MPYRKIPLKAGLYYHVFNRGLDGDPIFYSKDNYRYFFELMRKYMTIFSVRCYCYCLMPNHFHWILKSDIDDVISSFISRLLNAYVKALNKIVGRTGPLFVDRFRNVQIDKDAYLMHLLRYIHRNPVEAGLVDSLDQWPYSDYLEFIAKRNGTLSEVHLRNLYFKSPAEYALFVEDIQSKAPDGFIDYYLD